MIQLNLLPDIKLEFIKTQRNKRVVLLSALMVGGVSFTILLLLFLTVNVFQKKHLSDLNADIAQYTKDINGVTDINKVLTIQNQLNNLSTLHDAKPATTRLLGYIQQITPKEVFVSNLDTNFVNHTINISGNTDSLGSVNKIVDTLKFTKYKLIDGTEELPAFSNVVMANQSRDQNGASSYNVNFIYDPAIFDSKVKLVSDKLIVPNTITTRSETEKPSALFQPQQPSGSQ